MIFTHSPHSSGNRSDVLRVGDVERKFFHAPKTEKNANGDLYGQGDHGRDNSRADNSYDGSIRNLSFLYRNVQLTLYISPARNRFYAINAYFGPPASPTVADPGKRTCFKRLNRNHNEAPSDSIENTPGGRIILPHSDNLTHYPEVNGIAYNRFSEGVYRRVY